MNAECLACFLLFVPSGVTAHRMVLLTFRAAHPTSANSVQKLPPRHTLRLIQQVVLNPIKVAVNINHHIIFTLVDSGDLQTFQIGRSCKCHKPDWTCKTDFLIQCPPNMQLLSRVHNGHYLTMLRKHNLSSKYTGLSSHWMHSQAERVISLPGCCLCQQLSRLKASLDMDIVKSYSQGFCPHPYCQKASY